MKKSIRREREITKNKEILESESVETDVSMEDIHALLSQSDLSEKDFQEEWQLQASVYRELLWQLANIFVSQQEGLATEMTHSEYIRDSETGEVKTLYLCMEFIEEKGDTTERKSYEDFCKFLRKHPGFIPKELRKRFDVFMGFNYGDQGGLCLTEKNMELVTQEVLDALKSNGKIGYAKGYKDEDAFCPLLADFLKKKFTSKFFRNNSC